ncbi:MAG TPA: hypothetical protein IAB18_05415 [Candidatus Avisuccinivibrio pullicola]|nr:hypothetical protein [Candidatus Avisuccinivibrio pullicola]
MQKVTENASRSFDQRSWRSLVKLRYLPSWLSLGLLCLVGFLPARLRDLIALTLSFIAALVPSKPRRLVYDNLRTALPEYSAHECRVLFRRCVAVGLTVLMAYAQPSILPRRCLEKRWKVHGLEHLEKARADGRAILFIAPHCLAIDRCGLYLSFAGLPMCTMVHEQRNPVYDWFLNSQRLRFGGAVYERSAGLRTIIRELRAGHSCFFLPDQDLGEENSLFVDFLGVPKATLSSLPKLARLGNAQVMQLFSTYSFKSACFEVYFSPVYENYPTDDLHADLKRMNDDISHMIRRFPEQFMWFLRIFKTRPSPEYPNIYADLHYSVWKKGPHIDYAARRRPFNPGAKDVSEDA